MRIRVFILYGIFLYKIFKFVFEMYLMWIVFYLGKNKVNIFLCDLSNICLKIFYKFYIDVRCIC